FPAVALRERLDRLLLFHDLEPPTANLERLSEEDLAQLRQIAVEGVMANQPPALRYQAILLLGRYPSVQNLNLLEQLARYGEDEYVRSHALTALGATEVSMAGA